MPLDLFAHSHQNPAKKQTHTYSVNVTLKETVQCVTEGANSLEQIYWFCPAFCLSSVAHLNNKSASEQKAVIEMRLWKNCVIGGLILKRSLKQASFCSVELRFLHLLSFCLLWMACNIICHIHYICDYNGMCMILNNQPFDLKETRVFMDNCAAYYRYLLGLLYISYHCS